MKVLYNTNNWPYIKIKFTNNDCSDSGFEEHLNNFRNLYKLCEKNKEKMCIIFDLRDVPIGGLKYVSKQVQFNKEIKPLSEKHLEYSFFLTSKIGKHLLDMVFSFEKPVSPYTIFNKETKLIEFIKNYDSTKIYDDDMCEDIYDEANLKEDNKDMNAEYINSENINSEDNSVNIK